MENFFKIVTSMPWFVWLFFGIIVLKGVKALQTQVLPIKKLFLTPLLILCLGISDLFKNYSSLAYIVVWFLLFVMAIIFIYLKMKPLQVVCDRQKGLVQLPGNWNTLIILLAIFTSRCTFGFLSATHPEFKTLFFFNMINLSISGAVCGISSGRLFSLLMKFLKSPHVDLQDPK